MPAPPIDHATAAAIARRHARHGGAWLLALASTGAIDSDHALRPGPMRDTFRAMAEARARGQDWSELAALAHYIRTHGPRPAVPGWPPPG